MNTSLIFSNISKHIKLSEKEKVLISDQLEARGLKRNEYVLKQGDPCHYIHFITSGTLRAYFLNPGGKESTIMFAINDWWITDMYCFLNEKPAMMNIQAVEKSQVLRLSKRCLDELYLKIPSLNVFFRILMQNAYCREQLRMIQNLSLPAADRYENFLRQYPQIANKVPLKQIASYLGITPEFLSTIRATKN